MKYGIYATALTFGECLGSGCGDYLEGVNKVWKEIIINVLLVAI